MKLIKLKAISKLWQKLNSILATITEAFVKLVLHWHHSEQRQTTLGSTGNQTKILHFYYSFQTVLLNAIGLQFWTGFVVFLLQFTLQFLTPMPAETRRDNAELQPQAKGTPKTPVLSHVPPLPYSYLLRRSLLKYLAVICSRVLRTGNSADLADFWASNRSQWALHCD